MRLKKCTRVTPLRQALYGVTLVSLYMVYRAVILVIPCENLEGGQEILRNVI